MAKAILLRCAETVPATDCSQRNAVEVTRQIIWQFYRQLKVFKLAPGPKREDELRARFDRIFKHRTGYAMFPSFFRSRPAIHCRPRLGSIECVG